MPTLLNLQAALGQRTGVGHYTWELAQQLRTLVGTQVRLYPNTWEGRTVGWYERQAQQYEKFATQRGSLGRLKTEARGRLLALARRMGVCSYPERLRLVVKREGIDLYHEPFFIPLECDVPAVATVHDLSVILHPEWHRRDTVELFAERFHSGLKRCVHLIAISEFGKSEIVKHLGWPEDKVSLTYMGVRQGLQRVEGDRLAASLRALNLKEGYLLHVGTLEPRKNVLMLMKAYCDLPASVREKHPLVLVGGKGWNSDEVHTYLNDHARHHNVRWLGYVQEKHFPALYSAARALVFPTFYEGFGMPTVEMFATGGAVLASTAGAVAETAGSQAHLIDPHDLPAWRDSMFRVCTDLHWWLSLRHGAELAAASFTWRRCAEDTYAVYQKIVTGLRALRVA